jgi:opacity protein-like surface antigen
VKKIFYVSVLASLSTLTTVPTHAEPYYGMNIGGNITTIAKDINYLNTTSSVSNKYYGARGQLLIGYNFHLRSYTNYDNPDETDGNQDYSDRALNRSTRANNGNDDDPFYFAVEIDASYNSGEASENISPWYLNNTASIRERQRYNIDIFVLPKYRVLPYMIVFIGPGLTQGLFNADTTSETAGSLGITGDASTWLTGWGVKAGVEIPLQGAVNLVFTYQLSNYKSVTWTRPEPLTGENITGKYMPVVNSVTVGLNFH